ncbi:MAG: two-component system sensor histidine kinase NtrB [Planctomycetota bacterium]
MQKRHSLQSKSSGKVGKQQESSSISETNHQSGFGLFGNSIIQSLPVGVIVFGPDLKVIQANPQATKLIELEDYIDKTLAKGVDNSSASKQDWTEQIKAVLTTKKTRRFESITYRFFRKDRTKSLRILCIPLDRVSQKDVTGGAVIIEEITEKVSIQRQLTNTQKLATVGRLASKVAHELNNPMDGILRYINLAMRIVEQEKLEKPKEYLTQCRQALMRMVHIISELLEFSRSTYALTEECVDIEQIIEDAIKTMDMRAEASNIRVLRNYRPGIPKITSGNIFQVFYNLVKNALDAMPDGGQLRISTMLAADNNIVVEFNDTGTGFAPENADAIFEPFFTTKDKGKGTGLGLAICKDIIERCHGRITAENTSSGGSIFTVYLPVKTRD